MKPSQLLLLVLLGTLWGSSYLFIKVIVAGVDPALLVTGRLAMGAIFLVAMARVSRLPFPSGVRMWFHLAAMAVLGIISPQVLIAWSEQHVTSSLAAILNATTPFFTLAFAAGLFHTEWFTRRKVFGLLIGFIGTGLLTGLSIADVTSTSSQGEIALIGSSLFYGIGFAYARRFLHGAPVTLAAAQMVCATAIMIPAAVVFGDIGAVELTPMRLAAWIALGVLSSGIAYVIYFRLIAEVGATAASFTTYLMPIVGVFWGWLLLDETLGLRSLAGIVLILAGVAVATFSRPQRATSRGAERDTAPAATTAGGYRE